MRSLAAQRLLADPPLDPAPDEARSRLRRELLKPEYNEENLVQRLITWLQRQVDRGIETAHDAPPLQTLAAMLVALLLLGGLAVLLSRVRRTARERDGSRPVLSEESVTAAELRARAEAALAAGRHAEALVDGYRALALGQVERGRLDDAPGATAHELAVLLDGAFPDLGGRFERAATLFEEVLYGDRPATREQAVTMLALDDDLRSLR